MTTQVATGLVNPASAAPPRRPTGRESRTPITCSDSTCQASTSMLAAVGKLPSAVRPTHRSDPPSRCPTEHPATNWSTATADGGLDAGPLVSRRCTPGNHRGDVERPGRRLHPSPHAASSVELRRSTPPSTPGRVQEDVGRAGYGRAASTRVHPQRLSTLDVYRSSA